MSLIGLYNFPDLRLPDRSLHFRLL